MRHRSTGRPQPRRWPTLEPGRTAPAPAGRHRAGRHRAPVRPGPSAAAVLLGLLSAGAAGALAVVTVDAIPPAAKSVAALAVSGQLRAGPLGAVGPQAVPVAAVAEQALPGLAAEPAEPGLQRLRLAPAPRVGTVARPAAAKSRPSPTAKPSPSRASASRASRSRREPAVRETAPRTWVLPTYGRFSSPFGYRWGRLHAGIDLAAPIGRPIVAAGSGVVVAAGREGGYGNVVRIRHASGTVTVYAHMSRISAYVGETVSAGELIGRVGNTGHSTGPHLHFEVRLDGTRPVNPVPWLRARGVAL